MKGFTGSLLPGTREGRDPALNEGVPLPAGAEQVLGIVEVSIECEEVQNREEDVPHGDGDLDSPVVEDVVDQRLDVNADLIVQLMENL